MQEDKLSQLQRTTGCDPILGRLLLKFTGEDIDGAIKIIKSVEKDIIIIRGKFIAQSSKVYGTFIFLYDSKNKNIDRISIVVKKEDKTSIEFKFVDSWNEFEDKLRDYLINHVTDIDLQEKFIYQIKTPRAMTFYDKYIVRKKEYDEKALKSFFNDVLFNITGDASIAIKLRIDKTDAFEVNKGDVKVSDFEVEKEYERKEEPLEPKFKNEDVLNLNIDPELAPVEGVEITELKPGELISVKIIDNRPIADYISSLLNAKDPVTNENILIYTRVKEVIFTDEGYIIKVEFGPGIYGVTYFGENVKLRVAKNEDGMLEDSEYANNLFIRNFWIVGGILVVSIIILLLLITKP